MNRILVLLLLPLGCARPASMTPTDVAPARTVAPASAEPPPPVAPRAVSPPPAEATVRDPDVERLEQLELAREQFRSFLERAAGRDDFDEAVQRARERIADIGTEMEFLRQGIAQRRLEELGQEHP